jgi:tape measure domain-containing protein
MATGNNRDVVLGVGVNVSGADDVQGLSAQIRELAKSGGDAAPSFTALADRLDESAAATEKFREVERAARAELAQLKQARDTQVDALARYRLESDKATRATAEFSAKEKEMRLALISSRASIRDKQKAVEAATASAKTAANAERTLAQQVKATQSAYRNQSQQVAAGANQQVAANSRVAASLAGIGDQLRTLQRIASVAIGGQLLGGVIGDVTKAADAYSNLAARIKLATGEGAGFDAAFQGVFDVATRTNTAVEQTGNLFTRIAQAGAAIGVSNADALRLTESINQAVQISGASADSSSAAITQLVQGLQSGVLRGDEFNSVMENSPRLAKALADGLGVTTGELRKLAEAGSLTAATVIKSLQGQSAALQAEFATLPPTVGRALQNLSTEWTRYVGEADKATGASSAAATAINALANNLDTLGALLFSAGKAAAAYQALKLAQTFIGIGTAARAATAEVVALSAAQTAAGASSATAAARAGRLAGMLGTIKAVGLVAVLTNLREIGTAIGESVARWAGYGTAIDAVEKAARAEEATTKANASAKAELAQALQLATDKALGLTDVSRKMVGEFDEVITKGGAVGAALEKVAKSLDLSDLSGIANAGAALDALAVRGKVSATEIQTAYSTGLKGVDLAKFSTEARAVFDDSEQGARRLKAALDAVSEESLRRAGTSLKELQTGFSVAATAAINDVDELTKTLDTLGLKSADTGRALASSLDKATDAANTEKAIRAVIARLEDLGKRGLLSGDQLAQGLQKAKDKLDQILPGVNTLSEALRTFGLKSREELTQTAGTFKTAWEQIRNSTTVALSDKVKAFEQYRAAAVAANGGVVTSEIRVQEEILRARAAAEAAGKSIGESMGEAGRRVDDLADSFNRATDAADALRVAGQADRYAAPKGGSVTGSSREERLAGQAATDGSGAFALREKQRTRTLTAADLQAAEAVFSAAQFNKQMFDDNSKAYSLEGTRSIFEELNSASVILSQVREMAGRQSSTAQSTAPTEPANRSVRTVNINLAGRQTRVNVASEADADALTGLLRSLESAQGVSR